MNPRTLLTRLACLAILLAPAIARASADVTPPALVSLSFAPGSIDVSSSSQIIAITAEATDDSSGVEAISGYFRSPSGRQTVAFSMGYTQPESGTPLDAVYSTTVTFSTCAEQGTWTLASVEVTDECENSTLYAATASGSTVAFPAPDGIPIPTTINVTNSNPDLMTPQVTTFTYNPMSVDLTSTNMTVTAMITGSDISDGYFSFVSPSGKETKSGGFDSGELSNGVFTTTVTFDTACDEPGNWTLEYISADDGCGNSVSYGSSGLPLPTNTTVLSVTNPSPDVTAPMLESVGLSATMADVTNGPVSVTGSAVATDNISGVQSGSGYYRARTASIRSA